MASKTILVTGAGGYIGSSLVPRLLESGKRVIAVDRYFFGSDKLADHPNLTKLRTDVRLLEPSAFRSVDAVIDLAALSNDPLGDLFTDETWEINHQARARNARLAKAAGVKRYVMPSSCSIYGFFPPSQILDEDCTPNPLTVYAKANLAAEQDIRPLADDDFTVGVVRFSTLFGISPRMRFDLAVNGMTETAWRTGKLALMRDGTQWRPMIHVRDAARTGIHAGSRRSRNQWPRIQRWLQRPQRADPRACRPGERVGSARCRNRLVRRPRYALIPRFIRSHRCARLSHHNDD
ncbi:UDP-glucose 4-epimerase [Hyphomicrobium sulfonivorans]|uniref:UDP-glucose 4-epimerase n=1 Tax=Hyphomicrobium sulfonivorans TaxID=121290 RepID=A0A109BLI3_HYPSL|nr:SDR family oxidoreductase [Hyphomicrobium sulfonivorans]KWT71003.1 UDP-glucose 4-epimerase [Hyphomicrobium sulfonivorans]